MKIVIATLAALVVAGGAFVGKDLVLGGPQDNVVAVANDEAAMTDAVAAARKALPDLYVLMADEVPGLYLVKYPLTTGERTEHIWARITGMPEEEMAFQAVLVNDPIHTDALANGSAVTVPAETITDWMVETPAGTHGGYTQRLLLANEDGPEYEAMRAAFLPLPDAADTEVEEAAAE